MWEIFTLRALVKDSDYHVTVSERLLYSVACSSLRGDVTDLKAEVEDKTQAVWLLSKAKVYFTEAVRVTIHGPLIARYREALTF